jgi:hypothetical protein
MTNLFSLQPSFGVKKIWNVLHNDRCWTVSEDRVRRTMNVLGLICRPENTALKIVRQRSAIAFLMGAQPRLGEHSPIILVETSVLDIIAVAPPLSPLNYSEHWFEFPNFAGICDRRQLTAILMRSLFNFQFPVSRFCENVPLLHSTPVSKFCENVPVLHSTPGFIADM